MSLNAGKCCVAVALILHGMLKIWLAKNRNEINMYRLYWWIIVDWLCLATLCLCPYTSSISIFTLPGVMGTKKNIVCNKKPNKQATKQCIDVVRACSGTFCTSARCNRMKVWQRRRYGKTDEKRALLIYAIIRLVDGIDGFQHVYGLRLVRRAPAKQQIKHRFR